MWNRSSPPEVGDNLPEQLRCVSTWPLCCFYCSVVSLCRKYCLNLSLFIIADDGLVSSMCLFVDQREIQTSSLDLRRKNLVSRRCRRTPDFKPPQPWTSLTSQARTHLTGTRTSPLGFLASGHRTQRLFVSFIFNCFSPLWLRLEFY